MSSANDPAAPTPPAPSGPSVFISYASEDRLAARALRNTLLAAGLEVWYDEQELTGGDAWDQKIRRQIRDCEYFMPLISATTEARKEGYFRREWRLATERSLDMADDVLFIVPIVIDDTSEQTARVPDKFLTVQWLRTPGGNPTPALHHLMRRMLAGDHQAAPRTPTGATRAPFQRTQPVFSQTPIGDEPPPLVPPAAAAAASNAPPLMPPMPHVPEKGGFLHGIKFILEVLWWALTAAWMLFNRLPKWARIVVTVWLVITLFSFPRCSFGSGNRNSDREAANARKVDAETEQAIKAVAEQFAQAARDARKNGNSGEQLAQLGSEIAKRFAPGAPGAPDGAAMGKRLVMVPFSRLAPQDPAEKFANAVFASLYGRLTLTHTREVGLLRQQQQGAPGDGTLYLRGKALGAALVLTGHLTGEGDARALEVRVLATEDRSTKWTDTYPIAGAEPTDIADKIAENVLPLIPKREPRKEKNADKGNE